MTARLNRIAALVAVAAALAACPVLAAEAVPGNRGPADKPQNRAAPLTLPGRATPGPTPKLDPSRLGRDVYGGSVEAGIERLTTVTRSADGTVTESDPSDALRAIIESAVRGHRTGQ
jgi:hypothetical protein